MSAPARGAVARVAMVVGLAAVAACGSRGDDRRRPGRDASAGATPSSPEPRAPHRPIARDVAAEARAMVGAVQRGAIPATARVAADHAWRSFGAPRAATAAPAPADLAEAKALRAAFTDLEITPARVISTGDRILVEGTLTGKHTAAFAGVAPTSKQVGANVFYLGRLRDGEIVESVAYLAEDELVAQLQAGVASAAKPSHPLAVHREAQARLDPDGFQELHQITAFAVAARAGGDATARALARGEMTPAEVKGQLAKVTQVARTSRLTIGIRETFGAGPYVVARFKLTQVGPRATRVTVEALTVARVRAGRVERARVYVGVGARP